MHEATKTLMRKVRAAYDLVGKLECVRCGFCCSIDICKPGKYYFLFKKGIQAKAPCPALVWNEKDGRTSCSIIEEFTEDEKKHGLKLGRGCGRPDSPWREQMKQQDEDGETKPEV